jgi:hypothetical protein
MRNGGSLTFAGQLLGYETRRILAVTSQAQAERSGEFKSSVEPAPPLAKPISPPPLINPAQIPD